VKLVADEGVDKPIIDALRAAKFRVTYFAEEAPGADDPAILAMANEAETLLLTCDKDFGELVYRQRLTTAGVLLIRLPGLAPETKARLVTDAVQIHLAEMLNAFSVITPGLLRIRSR
jgi:predicted nuclease of predicted toxin-antitoxin system